MIDDTRRRLAAQQAELVSALSEGAAPADFNATLFRATADALRHKRARAVAKCCPVLPQSLGAGWRERFLAYARTSPLPNLGGALADGRAFARYLASRGELTDDARHWAMNVDFQFETTADGLRPRRGFRLGFVYLATTKRLVIRFGCPRRLAREFTLRLWPMLSGDSVSRGHPQVGTRRR